MNTYYASFWQSYDLVIHSSNMTADCDAYDYHRHYGSALTISFDFNHIRCSGIVNYFSDLQEVRMTEAENY